MHVRHHRELSRQLGRATGYKGRPVDHLVRFEPATESVSEGAKITVQMLAGGGLIGATNRVLDVAEIVLTQVRSCFSTLEGPPPSSMFQCGAHHPVAWFPICSLRAVGRLSKSFRTRIRSRRRMRSAPEFILAPVG